MAPRRGTRVVKVDHVVNYDNLTVKQVLCPICRSILIEPVTLPCNHVFCSSCFKGTMENANLVCPLCRMRIGSWLRSSKKENKLINIEYWNAIKKLFPDQIKNKLDGIEENLDYDAPLIRLAEPGELNKEYQTQFHEEAEKIRKEREAESKASEDLIRKLKEEDEYQKIVEEEKLKLDEEIAKELAENLSKANGQDDFMEIQSGQSTSKFQMHNNHKKKVGPLDRFLKSKGSNGTNNGVSDNQVNLNAFAKKDYTCRILCQDIGNNWSKSNKNINVNMTGTSKMSSVLQQVLEVEGNSDSSDSIDSEYRYFKPIDYRRNTPCVRSKSVKVPAIKLKETPTEIRAPKGLNNFKTSSRYSAFASFTTSSCNTVNESNKTRKSARQSGIRHKNFIAGKVQPSRKRDKVTYTQKKLVENGLRISIPDKRNNNSIIQGEEHNGSSSPILGNERELLEIDQVHSSSKRKSINDNITKKKSKCTINDSIRRLLVTPSSPFKGFSDVSIDKKSFEGSNESNNIDQLRDTETSTDNSEEERIKLQVKADYELAKKLQSQINSASYSTRSSAPKRGIKVTKQTTLDNVLVKKS